MPVAFDSHGYPVKADRIEALEALVGSDVPVEDFYSTDDAGAVLILGAGRVEPGHGPFWLSLLCGHYLFSNESTGLGFGTAALHVACPKCHDGVEAIDHANDEE